jgi:hypothetical protein
VCRDRNRDVGGEKHTPGRKVLKDRRSPRQRGRTGTSVNANAPLSTALSVWPSCSRPTGMMSLPPGASCSISASGMDGDAAPTWMASYGARPGHPFLPSAVARITSPTARSLSFPSA